MRRSGIRAVALALLSLTLVQALGAGAQSAAAPSGSPNSASPSPTPSGNGTALRAMVWPAAGRSPAFDPASVESVLADYDAAHAVLATRAQLDALRSQHFLVDEAPQEASDLAALAAAGPRSATPTGTPGPAYYVVRFVAPPTPAWTQRVADLGGWLPPLAALSGQELLFRLTAAQANAVAQDPAVLSVAPAATEGRLAPALAALPASAWANVSVLLFDPADAAKVAAQVTAQGGTLLGRGTPSNVLQFLARAQAGAAASLARLPEVRRVEPYATPKLANNVAAGIVGVAAVRSALNLTGAGETVAVADTGLDTGNTGTIHPDFAGRVVAHFGYGRPSPPGPDPNQIYQWDDPNGHGTHVAGSVLGSGAQSSGSITGMAPGAHLVMQSILDANGGLGGLSVGVATVLQDAYNQGARIQTNSWGSTCGLCPYSVSAAAYDDFLFHHPDLLVLFSAGNAGADANANGVIDTGSMSDPATAKDVLSVGASENVRSFPFTWGNAFGYPAAPIASDPLGDNANGMAAFSSRGPTVDGRIKPDLVAPGTYILSTRSSEAPTSNYWFPYDSSYAYDGGTSMATPITAGAAAVVRQEYRLLGVADPSAALLKATLLNSAGNLAPGQYGTGATQEIGGAPDFSQGWGRLDVAAALAPANVLNSFTDRTAGLTTGQVADFPLMLANATVPFQATLAWTDAAGAPGCNPCLVNDLDLTLTGPTGTVYRGNQFLQPIGTKNLVQSSAAGAAGRDARNNVERIRLPAGAPVGVYHLRVLGTSVPSGPQPFALVESGGFGALADVQATLSRSIATPLVGDPYTFLVTVHNQGPGAADGVTVTDTLPAGSYGVPVASQGSCTRVLAKVTCLLGTLASNGTATVTLPLTPLATGTATDTASAAVTGASGDPVPANNAATSTATVQAPPSDLGVAALSSPEPDLVGTPLLYVVTVTNNGPHDAAGVTLTDLLPSTATYGAATPSQGSCTRVSTTLTCLLGALANGANATVTLPATPTAPGTASSTISVVLTGGGIDPVATNNRLTLAAHANAPSSNLVVTNTDSADPLFAGQPLTYTVTVLNNGPNDAPGVMLTDNLPTGMAYGAASASQGSCVRVSSTLTCTLGGLANGTSATILIPMTPTAAALATNTAAAGVTGGGVDPVLTNNRAVQTTRVNAPATDLVVTNTDSADPLLTGQPLTYTVTVLNNGPNDAPGVTLTDNLPTGMAYGVATTSQGACTRVASTLTCLLGGMANGTLATITIPMTPTAAQLASNTAAAAVTGGGVDGVLANNRVVQTTRVNAPSTNLVVTNVDSADPLLAGQPLTYTVTVHNNGPDDAPGVTLTDSLPSGMAYGVATTSQGTCTRVAATLTCLLGGLANGATATVTLPMTPTMAGSVSNTASAAVTGGGIDPVLTDNRVVQPTKVNAPSANLVVTNVDSVDPLLTGQPLTYTVTVHNNGPDDAPGVTLSDSLPAGMAYGTPVTSQGATGGSCTRSFSTLTCLLGGLANGATATVTLPMTPTMAGSVSNTASATVTGGGVDPNVADNRVVQVTRVNASSSDLAVTNVDSVDPGTVGVPLNYTVTVTNNGPDDAPGVTLTDNLPAAMTYGTAQPSQGACTRSFATLTCLLGPLAHGAAATIVLPMTPLSATTVSNTATAAVTGGGLDPATTNNRVVQSTVIHT